MEIGTSNHAKYQEAESSPLVRGLMDRLFAAVRRPITAFHPQSLLDAGCGEGHAVDELAAVLPPTYLGIDANPACIDYCRARHPGADFRVASVVDLPFADAAFDVVLCMEVLEHLDDPARGLSELARVARVGVVLSVPFEPVFQLGNALRGKYPATWGNHPEHVQHWGRRSFPRWLARSPALRDIRVGVAGPWLVASARVAR